MSTPIDKEETRVGDVSEGAIRLELLAGAEIDELRTAVLTWLARSVPGGAQAALAALSTAPGGWTMAGRGDAETPFGNSQTLLVAGGLPDAYLAHDGTAPGGEPRPTTLTDTEAFSRLADALSQVAAVEPLPVTDTAAVKGARLAGVAAAFAATGKHLLAVVLDDGEAHAAIDMATLVAGGADDLRERPLVTLAAPPFAAAEVAQVAAAAGVPCLITLSPDFLGAAPANVSDAAAAPAAATSRAAAETGAPSTAVLDGLAAAFADGLAVAADVLGRVPGAAIGFALPPWPRAPLDAGVPAVLAAAAQLSHSFGLPLLATALATQAPASGWLASAENTAAALACALAGVDGLAGAGLLAGGDTASAVALALDAEIYSYVTATTAGVPVDDDTLAVETIQKVGIAGNYLGERHTRRHMRDVWRPRFFDRTPYEQWVREDRRQSIELAREFVRATLVDHTAPPLDAALADRIADIAHRAGKETP
jgi:trimethylamine--corrinoid protein Co-methyltransferase